MDLSKLGGSSKKQKAEWLEFQDGARILILPQNDPVLQAKLAQKSVLMMNQFESLDYKNKEMLAQVINDNVEHAIEVATMQAEHIIVDWENLSIEGEPFEFNKKNVGKLVTDYPELLTTIVVFSEELVGKRTKLIDSLKKTSEQSSTTNLTE